MKKMTKPNTNWLKNRFFAFLILMITCLSGFSIDLPPVPSITGPLNSQNLPATLRGGKTPGQVYKTEVGMIKYVWSVSQPAGHIIDGQKTSSLTVDWINPISQQFVSVTYTDPETGLSTTKATVLIINYYPFLPAIDPTTIPKFVDPLPHFAAGLRVDAKTGGNLQIKTVPVRQIALSTGTILDNGTIDPSTPEVGKGNYAAYAISKDNGATFGPAMWPAQTIEAKQGNPITVKYINDMVGMRYSDFNILADQTLMMNGYTLNGDPHVDPYNGPIPMVVHLHGGEMPSGSDGGPSAWFMPTGTVGVNKVGPGFAYNTSDLSTYPNQQEATTLWYHPHDDGLTRINVYTGLAGYYFLRGADEEAAHLAGWSGDDKVKENTPDGKTSTFNGTNTYLPEIELGIQDRMFNVNGELYWPIQPTNPELHPFWTPEFFGNVMIVNGKAWPYLSVAPRRYRFRILEGCNARFLNMWLADAANGGTAGPEITVIGGEGGLLATPVAIDPAAGKTLFMAPGQRYDVIIDFTGMKGKTFTLMNNANAPYPTGDPIIPGLTDRIMQFVVNGDMVSAVSSGSGTDKSAKVSPSFNLRPVNPLVKLTNFKGALAPMVVPDVKRQLLLNEVATDGGPAAVLINNSFFDVALALPGAPLKFGGPTEIPREGTTELWQIINTSVDAHPIHIHLTQWQLVSRQKLNTRAYMADYSAAWTPRGLGEFPVGLGYPGGAGSPFPYDTLRNGFLGGNPDVTPSLMGEVIPANPEENGWKDNVIVLPGQVTTFITRFAPTDKPVNAPKAELRYPFNPSEGPGYVWHCHIIDHEDMSMMRPLPIAPSTFRVPHFKPVWSGNGNDHMNFYARSAKNNGIDLQPGDEIGIFDGLVCVGAGVLTKVLDGGNNYLEMKVSRDNSLISGQDGYITDHKATFKLWNAAKQSEISTVNITYISGDNNFFAGASTSFNIGGFSIINQKISLLKGWNIFSLYVTPERHDMLEVVKPLITAGKLVKVQDETGQSLEFMPSTPTTPSAWVNNIDDWCQTEGYKIRVNDSTSLIVDGLPIYQPVTIRLAEKWNIISYPVSTSQNAMLVLNDLVKSGHLVKVQNESGAAMEYIPGSTQWINNIGNFNPGEGYKVNVSDKDSLTINPFVSGSNSILKSSTITAVPEYFKPVWKGNGLDHMNFYMSETNGASVLKAGNEIGIYDGSLCVGAAVIQNTGNKLYSFVVSADDPTTSEIDGFIKGHTPSFRVWDQASNSEASIESLEYYSGSSRIFEPMATAAIGINTMVLGLKDHLEDATSLGDNYPNPFMGETTIPYIVGNETTVDISIFDMLGKKLNTLVHGNLQSGSYTTVWKVNDHNFNKVNPGIYVCKMLAADKVFVKLIVVK